MRRGIYRSNMTGEEVFATQWFRNGDHPNDNCELIKDVGLSEGKVVRYLRHPEISGGDTCDDCDYYFHVHGWIDNGGEGIKVCPGDFITEDFERIIEVIKPNDFRDNYKLVRWEFTEEGKIPNPVNYIGKITCCSSCGSLDNVEWSFPMAGGFGQMNRSGVCKSCGLQMTEKWRLVSIAL